MQIIVTRQVIQHPLHDWLVDDLWNHVESDDRQHLLEHILSIAGQFDLANDHERDHLQYVGRAPHQLHCRTHQVRNDNIDNAGILERVLCRNQLYLLLGVIGVLSSLERHIYNRLNLLVHGNVDHFVLMVENHIGFFEMGGINIDFQLVEIL